MPYAIRYTRATNHIEGIAERSTGPLTDNSATTGVVSYYATSACAALSRSGHKMGITGEEYDNLATALEDARTAGGRNLCKNCERAATGALERAYDIAQRQAQSAEAQREYSAGRSTEHVMEGHEARAERTFEAYRIAADSLGRCLIFGCEAPTHESSAWCEEHTDRDDTEDTATAELPDPDGSNTIPVPDGPWFADPAVAAAGRASTFGKPYTAADNAPYTGCEARIYHNGVGSPCGRPRGHEGVGGTAHRTTTRIEWMPGQTRPSYCPYVRTSKGCDDCKEHAELVDRILACGKARTYTEAEALAVAMEEEPEAFAPLTVDPEAVYNARRALYRTAADLYEEHGGEANRDATAAAWNAFVTAARLAGKCIAFTCYADAEPGADHCQRHRQHVTARLDHTEPGKAIALIGGDHGREHAPQAWLAHEGGSWLLVDDYDGDTLNVKGPDPNRAVHAWAALLGLRIDALAVEVEYAGGPVSPPVREPERPVAPLNWVRAASGTAAAVFVAGGRAHTYRVTEHADAAGASLVGTLRGTTVDTYRRGYMTADDARKAAEHYEARYGSAYVPAE